jgi:hypothetical protein
MRFLAGTIHDFATQTPTPNLQLHVGGGHWRSFVTNGISSETKTRVYCYLGPYRHRKTFLNSVQL